MNRVKIKNCCNLIDYRGKTPEKSDSGYILITAKNVKDDGFSFEPREYIPKENYDAVMVRGIPESGDVLFTTEAPLGNVCRIPEMKEPFAVGQRIVVICPKDDILRKDFLEHVLKSQRFRDDMWRRSSGSTVKGIRTKELIEIEIPIPDLKQQKTIAESLNKISIIINARQQQLEELDNLIKSRFVEMFGDPVKNTMNWQVCKLGDLSVQINSGNTPKGGEQVYVDKGITFFRSQNVWKDRLEMEDIAFIDKETHENMKRSSLKHGDILMTKTGRINTENSSLGRAALYLGEDDTANVNGHVYFIRLKPEINNEFVLKILVSKEYLRYIRSVCVGGIDKRQLNKNHIEDFPIICPPKDMQKKFIEFVQQVEKLKVKVKNSLDETQVLFDSLMLKYFD